MSKNYIVINGRKAILTEDQMRALGIIESQDNPFGRVPFEEHYYYIDQRDSAVLSYTEKHDNTDEGHYNSVNYFNDKTVAEQVALHQLLYRKLLKFAYDHGCADTAEWDCRNWHYCIVFDADNKHYPYRFECAQVGRHCGAVYFSSKEGAYRAIKEVVEPFMKEHPSFNW